MEASSLVWILDAGEQEAQEEVITLMESQKLVHDGLNKLQEGGDGSQEIKAVSRWHWPAVY